MDEINFEDDIESKYRYIGEFHDGRAFIINR